MTSVQRVLLDAADLVERGWTQGAFARTVTGDPCPPNDSAAVCWCTSGALLVATKDEPLRTYGEALRRVGSVVSHHAQYWNDAPGRTQAEVVQALRDAAAMDGAA